jgi:hypothetical protein
MEYPEDSRNKALRLLIAIYEKTCGRRNPVFIHGLNIGLEKAESEEGWRYLKDKGLIETFSIPFTARASAAGVDLIEAAQRDADESKRNSRALSHPKGASETKIPVEPRAQHPVTTAETTASEAGRPRTERQSTKPQVAENGARKPPDPPDFDSRDPARTAIEESSGPEEIATGLSNTAAPAEAEQLEPDIDDAAKAESKLNQQKKRRGRPTVISDELKLQALGVQGGKARAKILYQTSYPTAQQVKNVSSLLRHFEQTRRKSE